MQFVSRSIRLAEKHNANSALALTRHSPKEAALGTFETVVILLALSLPVWLVSEQVYAWWRAMMMLPEGQIESGHASGIPDSSVSAHGTSG